MGTPTYRVFISYKRRTGEDFARHLKEGLEAERISAFLDIKDIPKKFKGMSEWWRIRDEAISQSEVFLLIITDGIETSPEVAKELEYACAQKNIEFVFLRHKGLQPQIMMDLGEKRLNLKDFEQTEFETKEDLLRQALRILRETPIIGKLREKTIPVTSSAFSEGKGAKGFAEELLKKAVSTEEIVGRLEDYEVDFLRGRWFSKNKNYEKALTHFDRVLALKPDFLPCMIEKSIALEALGKHDEAITWLDKAIELKPTFIAFALKGTILDSLKRYEQAIDSYDRAMELGSSAYVYYNKGVALDSLGRYSEAITCYEKAIEMDPSDASYWHNKAFALFKVKRFQEVVPYCDKALEITPTAPSWLLKGLAYAYLGKMNEAKGCFEEALKIEMVPVALIYLSETLLIIGDWREGLATADKAFYFSKTPNERAFSWFLRIAACYLGKETKKALNETKLFVDFLRLEKGVKIGDDVSLMIPTIEKKLEEENKSTMLSLVSLLKKEIGLEDFLKKNSTR